jgi:hypothetical protein
LEGKSIVIISAVLIASTVLPWQYWKMLDGRIAGLEEKISKQSKDIVLANAVRSSLQSWSAETKTGPFSGPGGGRQFPASQCPDGSYVVGIRANGNTAPPYCIDCLVGVQVICKPLDTN